MSFEIEERRIDVADLQPGMFVSRLDRPWEKTPFPCPTGSLIKLNTDEVAIVMVQNRVNRLRPCVTILSSPSMQPRDGFRPTDLMQLRDKGAVDIVRSLAAGDYGIDTSRFFL